MATLAVQMGNCNQTAGGFPGKSLVLYGCSDITSPWQQLEAICAVGSVSQARVIGRNQERRERFASRMSERLNLEVAAVDSVQDCVSGTDVVALHSGSGAGDPWLVEGTHVNAAGGNHWMRREVDEDKVARSELIVGDDLDQAKIGLIWPEPGGGFGWKLDRGLLW